MVRIAGAGSASTPRVLRTTLISTRFTLFGGSSYEKPSTCDSACARVGREMLISVSLPITEFGITTRSRARVRTRTERQFISITSPVSAPTVIQSPTWNGRSNSTAMPTMTLSSVFCSARPSTIELTPSAVSRPLRSCFQTPETTKQAPISTRIRRRMSSSSFG